MNHSPPTVALFVAVIALAALASAGAVATAGTSPVSPTHASDAAAGDGANVSSATLGQSIVMVQQGDVARLRLGLEHTDVATVTVGAQTALTVVATDGNDDGTVSIALDLAETDDGETTVAAEDGADTLDATWADRQLGTGEYDVDVYPGQGTDGNRSDVGTLLVVAAGELPDTNLVFESDAVTLHPESGQTVTGTTELEAGWNLTVRLRSSGSSPFIRSTETTVNDDGTFTATFDLSSIEPPANATASVYGGGEQLAGPVDVEIVAAPTDTATPVDTTDTGPTETRGQPGFGAAVAVVAVLLGLLARRW